MTLFGGRAFAVASVTLLACLPRLNCDPIAVELVELLTTDATALPLKVAGNILGSRLGNEATDSLTALNKEAPKHDVAVLGATARLDDIRSASQGILPGGVVAVISPSDQVVQDAMTVAQALNRGCFNDDYVSAFGAAFDRRVKAVVAGSSWLAFFLNGVTDMQDYMVNGDYGRAYGEGRGQLIPRTLTRQAVLNKVSAAKRLAYFDNVQSFYQGSLAFVDVSLRLKPKAMPKKQNNWGKLLTEDLAFGLGIHEQRVVPGEFVEQGKFINVTVRIISGQEAAAFPDYNFRKDIVWKTWKSYWDPLGPQPLHAVAQSIREKFNMVKSENDESDIYKGQVTRAMEERGFRIVLGGDCEKLVPSLNTHRFASCVPATGGDPAILHSALYRVFGKEKLDCCVGKGAWGGLFDRLRETSKTKLPPGITIDDREVRAGNTLIGKFDDGNHWQAGPSGKTAKRLSAKIQKLGPLASADDVGCLRWSIETFWPLLAPGGVYAMELDGCHRNGNFETGPPDAQSPLGQVLTAAAHAATKGEAREPINGMAYIIFHVNLVVVVKSGKLGAAPVRETEEL